MEKSISSTMLNWDIAYLVDCNDKKTLNFDIAIQRGKNLWSEYKNSMLIHSILLDYPISIFYFNLVGRVNEGIEGKQRNNAIYSYVKDGYKLHSKTPPVEINGVVYKIANHKFSHLEEELRDRILAYRLLIQRFNNLAGKEIKEIFTRINSGKPITSAELARIDVKSRDIFIFLSKHKAIESIVSPRKRDQLIDEDIIEDIWCMTYSEKHSLLNTDRAPFLANNEITDEQKEEINKSLDYMHVFYKEALKDKNMFSKLHGKTHIVSLGYMGIIAGKKGMSQKEFVEKAKKFFGGEGRIATISEDYNKATRDGSAKPEQIRIRMNELKKALEL